MRSRTRYPRTQTTGVPDGVIWQSLLRDTGMHGVVLSHRSSSSSSSSSSVALVVGSQSWTSSKGILGVHGLNISRPHSLNDSTE